MSLLCKSYYWSETQAFWRYEKMAMPMRYKMADVTAPSIWYKTTVICKDYDHYCQ